MAVKTYNSYKDSGIPWIGQIPTHWEVIRNKYYIKYIKGKNPELLNSQGIGVPYIGASELDNLLGTAQYTNYTEPSNLPLCTNNNVLILWDGARAGLIGKNHAGVISSTIIKLTPNSQYINENFLFYYLKAFEKFLYDRVNGTTIPHMNRDYIEEIKFINIPINEQQAIADYLDDKCAKIDKIIETEKAVIEKLKEYKQSLITETITKGLNPSAPMKDSGIPWIGKIPAHWEVCKIKNYIYLKTGNTPSSKDIELLEGDYNWFTPADFTDKIILKDSTRKISIIAKENNIVRNFPLNTVFIVGIGATTGKIGISCIEASCNQQITAMLTKSNNIYSKFLMYWMLANSIFIRDTALSTTLPIINNTTLGQYLLLRPTIKEQQAIADYLDDKCAKIEKSISDKEQIIEKLTEYKKSLIYECITGKRKVI